MTDRRTELLRRIELLEKEAAPNSGWAVFATLTQIASLADRLVPCVACEVTDREGHRVRFDRMAGESLEALHRRANPSGSWRSHPTPVMGEIQPLVGAWRLGG